MFQILCIAERGAHLSVSEGRVAVRKKDSVPETFVSFDDLDAVIVEENAVSLTGSLLAQLAGKRIPVILCDTHHLPAAFLSPVISHSSESHQLLRNQISAPLPWKKQMWQKLIRAKIAGQSANLLLRGKKSLAPLIPLVRSGDPGNIEARAAAAYWQQLHFFPARQRDGRDANILFNYAYTILYSVFARYLCAAALNPDIGIHHHGKYNPFSLASDLMEPFRPIVDSCVFLLIDSAQDQIVDLLPGTRRALLKGIYDCQVRIGQRCFALPDAVNEFVQSFKRALTDRDPSLLLLPETV